MPGQDARGIRQRVEALTNRAQKLFVIAPRQIRAPDAAAEQGVADEDRGEVRGLSVFAERLRDGVDLIDVPRVRQGLGIAIVTTSRGVMSDRACREARLGGEVVAVVS